MPPYAGDSPSSVRLWAWWNMSMQVSKMDHQRLLKQQSINSTSFTGILAPRLHPNDPRKEVVMPSPIGENEALKTALVQLCSDDVLLQNEGVATVIRIGAAAVPALLPLLEDGGAGRRAQVMYALAQIAEPGTAEAFQHGLGDQDERVRAYAAEGLAHIGHQDALTACLQTL